MTISRQFREKMAALNAAFARRSMAEAEELDALGHAMAAADNPGDRARMLYLAHRLAGSSATFGMVDVQQPAGELEAGLLRHASAEQIEARSADLAEAIRRACHGAKAGGEPDDTT